MTCDNRGRHSARKPTQLSNTGRLLGEENPPIKHFTSCVGGIGWGAGLGLSTSPNDSESLVLLGPGSSDGRLALFKGDPERNKLNFRAAKRTSKRDT